jgi:CDP-glucose 4,6-dehydratase
MSVLVTGASGFIGAHLAKFLLGKEKEVISIIHDVKPLTTAKLLNIEDKITWTHGSILDETFLKRVIADYEIEKIYHLAALPIVRVATRTTIPIFQTNIMGTCNILEAMKEQHRSGQNISMLFMSTDKVYGDAGEVPYNENMPLNALNPYEASKACADLITRCYNKSYELKTVIARPCNIFGEADLNSRLIPNSIKNCLMGKPPIIFKGITYVREFIYIKDACDALYLLMENIEKTAGEVYNIGSGDHYNQEEVINKILEYFPNLKGEYRDPPPYTRVEIPFQKLDTTKIYRKFGWKVGTTFSKGLENTINWYKANLDLLTRH